MVKKDIYKALHIRDRMLNIAEKIIQTIEGKEWEVNFIQLGKNKNKTETILADCYYFGTQPREYIALRYSIPISLFEDTEDLEAKARKLYTEGEIYCV